MVKEGKDKKVQVRTLVDPESHKRMKIQATIEDLSVEAMVAKMIETYINQRPSGNIDLKKK